MGGRAGSRRDQCARRSRRAGHVGRAGRRGNGARRRTDPLRPRPRHRGPAGARPRAPSARPLAPRTARARRRDPRLPENGPFDAEPARVGPTQRGQTQNAYGQGPVQRLITALRGLVRPGNSGGPLVDGARTSCDGVRRDRGRRRQRLRCRQPDRRRRARTRGRSGPVSSRGRARPDEPARRRSPTFAPRTAWRRRFWSQRSPPSDATWRARCPVPARRAKASSRAPARHHVGGRPPRAAGRARAVRPQVQALADGRPADPPAALQLVVPRASARKKQMSVVSAAQARRRRAHRQRVRRRARGRADLRLPVREGRQEEPGAARCGSPR